jgi:hypothetical protein
MHAKEDLTAVKASVRADAGQVHMSSQSHVDLEASKIHGEEGVAVSGKKGVDIRAGEEVYQGRYSAEKRYDHSSITAGKGQMERLPHEIWAYRLTAMKEAFMLKIKISRLRVMSV